MKPTAESWTMVLQGARRHGDGAFVVDRIYLSA
jgi:hypothetical protein